MSHCMLALFSPMWTPAITCSFCQSMLLSGRTPHTLPLLHRGVTPIKVSSPQFFSFPQAALIHKLFHVDYCSSVCPPAICRSLSMGCSTSRTACSSVGPLQDDKSCQQTCCSVWVHRTLPGAAPVCALRNALYSIEDLSLWWYTE